MIYTIGETVLDIIFNNIDDVNMRAGGSMLNTAVSLGRLGVEVSHISILSSDRASDMLTQFLQKNEIGIDFLYRSDDIKTNLAMAYLDEDNNAEYVFYKDTVKTPELKFPKVTNLDIIHFGSFFSITEDYHNILHNEFFNGFDKDNIPLVVYDPNFRKPHRKELEKLQPMIEHNFSVADVVKASDEDFESIYGIKTGVEAWGLVKKLGVSLLFYTKGAGGAELYSSLGVISSSGKPVKIVSTIGAGDTFSAGVIYFIDKMIKKRVQLSEISLKEWKECLDISNKFASMVCGVYDNYLPVGISEKYR